MSELLLKLRRIRLPSAYRHLYKLNDKFALLKTRSSYSLIWNGAVLRKLEGVSTVKGSCTGPCYILASGYSASEIPIDFLVHNHKSIICVNGSIQRFMETDCFPAYFAATDTDFITRRFDVIKYVLSTECIFFTTPDALSAICEIEPGTLIHAKCRIIVVEVANRYYFRPKVDWKIFREVTSKEDCFIFHAEYDKIGYSLDLESGFFCGKTITFRAAQISTYMGFDTIYFIGMDLGGARFYKQKYDEKLSRLEKDYERSILPSFSLCKLVCEKKGIRMFNVSMNSRLPDEVMPKIDWKELCQKKL